MFQALGRVGTTGTRSLPVLGLSFLNCEMMSTQQSVMTLFSLVLTTLWVAGAAITTSHQWTGSRGFQTGFPGTPQEAQAGALGFLSALIRPACWASLEEHPAPRGLLRIHCQVGPPRAPRVLEVGTGRGGGGEVQGDSSCRVSLTSSCRPGFHTLGATLSPRSAEPPRGAFTRAVGAHVSPRTRSRAARRPHTGLHAAQAPAQTHPQGAELWRAAVSLRDEQCQDSNPGPTPRNWEGPGPRKGRD